MLPFPFISEDIIGRDLFPPICQLCPILDDIPRIDKRDTVWLQSSELPLSGTDDRDHTCPCCLVHWNNLFNSSNVPASIYVHGLIPAGKDFLLSTKPIQTAKKEALYRSIINTRLWLCFCHCFKFKAKYHLGKGHKWTVSRMRWFHPVTMWSNLENIWTNY